MLESLHVDEYNESITSFGVFIHEHVRDVPNEVLAPRLTWFDHESYGIHI